MVRPRKCRRVDAPPDVTYFKPRGVPLRDLNEVSLSVEGYEALRLADYQGLKHEDAAVLMQVSRQTFGRILAQARRAVATAVINGWALSIRGGVYTLNGQETPAAEPVACKSRMPELQATGNRRNRSVKAATTGAEEVKMGKIAVSSEGPTLDDPLDPRFGRAAGFIVVDPQTLEFEYVDNGTGQAKNKGAGIQAANAILRAGANALLTGYVGPKAFTALNEAGIKVAQNLENMTVRQALERFNAGQLEWAHAPTGRGPNDDRRHCQRKG